MKDKQRYMIITIIIILGIKDIYNENKNREIAMVDMKVMKNGKMQHFQNDEKGDGPSS